ncbi:40595_t:CDS:2 [Gigaspora margarita]|uniref:40595_t:CDS:1 n=1 Tax=Gigaspora margarita TaxID=4874 RepID=A0ABM8W2L7_GIGMA|nr:40595_t:CDS:2 [Gigaspora margarita]
MPNINVEQKNLFVEQWMENFTQIFRRLMTEYPMKFTIDEINIALKEAIKTITSDEPEKHPLFEISSQLMPARYERIFNCYNKRVVRITKIVRQDILKIEKRNTKGRRAKDLEPYFVGKKAAKSKKRSKERME